MSKEWVFKMLRRNNHNRKDSIKYISDFLNIKKADATKIYETEYLIFLATR